MKRVVILAMTLIWPAAVGAQSAPRTWEPVGPTLRYVHVGTDPRGASVTSWGDALSYMHTSPKFERDLTVLLPQGVRPEYLPKYWEIVREVRSTVNEAVNHRFMMGGSRYCPVCHGPCQKEAWLSERLQRIHIPRGTRYLAVTSHHDLRGRVGTNYVFLGEADAYRVSVPQLTVAKQVGSKASTTYLDAYIDLIVLCRNAALGQPREWEAYTAFQPPTEAAPKAEATARARATATAQGGSVVVNNSITPAPLGYFPAPSPTMSYRQFYGGGLTFWPQQNVRVRISNNIAPVVKPTTNNWIVAPTQGNQAQVPLIVGLNGMASAAQSSAQTPVLPGAGAGIIQTPVPVQSPMSTGQFQLSPASR